MNMLEYLKDITDLAPYVGTPPFCGVRFNPLKISRERFEQLAPFEVAPCMFYSCGYRTQGEVSGTHPLHMSGGYYIQEPSAMSAITALQLQPTDGVLDMCAAPGSKATAVAAGCDILVANEINLKRARTLIGNIERMGVSNALVTSSDSLSVGKSFAGYFDKVLVDSPCSGEGMFRKHPEILSDWTPELVKMCARRSRDILQNAAMAVKAGGRLVYSTCTYNLEENEKVILDFLENNPDFEPADTGLTGGERGLLGLDSARRIFIKNGGEGHFVCALRRTGEPRQTVRVPVFKIKNNTDFLDQILCSPLKLLKDFGFGITEHEGVKYAVHEKLQMPHGVRIMRAGVKLGAYVSKTFKPDHHLFMSAAPSALQTFEADEESAARFLSGNELCIGNTLKGYTAVTYNGLTLGFGKASNGVLKNHLPHGLRIL